MWCLIRWLAAFWLASLLASPAVAQPELAKDIGIREANPGAKFLALVIGVSNYGNAQVKARGTAAPVPIPSLPGPREDAQDIASLVRQMGFVISNENQMFDLDRAAMQREISRFVSQLDEQTVALVYYSGHGLENQNENYLVPRSANLESVDDLRGQLVSLNEMLRDMGNRRAKARIVILDACRNFPDLEGGTKSLGDTGGFSEVKIGAGLRLVYAAEPGQRALPARARERNSVFTSALLSAVREPALGTFDQVIHRAGEITQELTRRSDGSSFQQPWIAGSAGMTFRLRTLAPPPLADDRRSREQGARVNNSEQQQQQVSRERSTVGDTDQADKAPGAQGTVFRSSDLSNRRRVPAVDAAIEAEVARRLALASLGASVRSVTYNGNVLLVGEVRSQAEKRDVAQTVVGIAGTRRVIDETSVSTESRSFIESISDSFMASGISGEITKVNPSASQYFTVFPHRGVVYLMGQVTEMEATQLANTASSFSGVKKVVRVFEIVTSR